MNKEVEITAKMDIDHILETFAGYIQDNPDFKIIYFPNTGYFRILPEGDSAKLETAEELIDFLLDDIIFDVAFSPYNREHKDNHLSETEKNQVRIRCRKLLEHADESEKAFYLDLIEKQMTRWPWVPRHPLDDETKCENNSHHCTLSPLDNDETA